MKQEKRYKIVYCTPSLYMAGGVERVLTLKANYFAEIFGYDITIITTDGKQKPNFFPLSEKVHVVQLDVNIDSLWQYPTWKRFYLYKKKMRIYQRRLDKCLNLLKPDITISLLRREINFLTKIHQMHFYSFVMHIFY